jgi:hypothetical protein
LDRGLEFRKAGGEAKTMSRIFLACEVGETVLSTADKRMTKTKTARRVTPGLRRLRAAPNAKTIRSEVLADQNRARAEARTDKTLAAEGRPGDSTSTKWGAAAGFPGPPDNNQRP